VSEVVKVQMRKPENANGRVPYVTREVGLAEYAAVRADEHQTVEASLGEPVKVCGDVREYGVGDRHGASSGF
jgi:hypothetical protein